MHQYRYKAISDDGKYVRGQMSAESPAELEVLLKNSKLYLVSSYVEKGNFFVC